MTEAIDHSTFRALMGSFASGVTVITALDERGAPHALTATAFMSVSATPPLCVVGVDHTSRAHAPLLATGRFAVNLLAAGQAAASQHFASKEEDKLTGQHWSPGPATGCPVLDGVLASCECEVVHSTVQGDHTLFVGRLVAATAHEGTPLLYFRGRYAEVAPHG